MAKISIIMGVYNCENTLYDAINSILNQSYDDWEFIICDDCSNDRTFDILKEYQNKYPEKFIILQNHINSKLAASLNHCLKYAKGEYIARMDGDDISVKSRLMKQVEFLDSHPQYDVVGSNIIPFDNNGDFGITKVPEFPNRYTMKLFSPYIHATIMMRKKAYDTLNGYTVAPETQRCEDAEMWFRFYKLGFEGYNIQEPLYKVREDLKAFKRRSFKYGIQLVKVSIRGFKLLDYPKRYYFYLLKPLLASFLPAFFMKFYHTLRSR